MSLLNAFFAGIPGRKEGFCEPGTARPTRAEWRIVGALQAIFLAIGLFHLDGPFVSTHFVRQCFTFDVAQHVFHDGWSAVVTPKGSFTQLNGPNPDDLRTPLNIPAPRYTICHMEFPFFGVLGWSAAKVFPTHERAVVRLVAIAFSILSIRLIFLILRHWLTAESALLGTALWTFAPLVLHFGQVGMPDILATTGIAAGLYASLRARTAASSAAFLFAVLAKPSTMPYGLPILVALAVAHQCGSVPAFIRLALAWGIAPLLGVLTLVLAGIHSPPGSWVMVGGYQPGTFGPLRIADLTDPSIYPKVMLKLVPFGCGLIGLIGLAFAAFDPVAHMNRLLKLSIIATLAANYLLERIVWYEPQYSVPVVFFIIVAASFGFPALIQCLRKDRRWLAAGLAILLVHVAVAVKCTSFLKASRVPDIADIEAASKFTPPDARIVAYCSTTNQVPPVWLQRNTINFSASEHPTPEDLAFLQSRLKDFHRAGFDYLIIFDTEHHAALTSNKSSLIDIAGPSSPTRQFLDKHYPEKYSRAHVVLYSLAH